MSIKLMSAVWELDLPPGEKLVLLALADQANDEGRQCWPSLNTIAARSGQNERTVRRALRSLETKGHLTSEQRTGTSSQYFVHPGHHVRPVKSPPRTKTTETPDTTPPKPLRTTSKHTQRARVIPDDWKPEPFGEKSKCAPIIAGWPSGELDTQIEHFTAHHRGKGNRFVDWQDAWKTWVLNSRKWAPRSTSPPNRSSAPGSYLDHVLAEHSQS